MRTGDIIHIKNEISKTEYEVIDVTYDRENNKMYTLADVLTTEIIEEQDFYSSELEFIR